MKGYPSNATTRPDHPAVVVGEQVLTYGQLDQRAARLAHVLRECGIESGARLGIMLPNGVEFFESLAASAKLGAASLAVNWHLRPDELAWILDDSGIAALITAEELRPQVEGVAAERDLPVLWVGSDYETRLAAASDAPVPYVWPTSWSVIYTSGTSGRPKGVVHGAMAAPEVMEMVQDALSGMWGYRADDVHLVAGPMYHAGPAGYAHSTLYLGGTVVVMRAWDAENFLRLVEHHRVTTTFLTPAHFIRLLELPDETWAAYDQSSLRHVLHAGAPCPRSVKERIIAALPGAEVWELYGMSEGGATRVSSTEWTERPGTVGQPWPGVQVHVRHPETGVEQPAGHDGLIWVTPAHGRFEYHNDPAKTAGAWREDAFTVGDIGHLDGDGWLFLTDRQSDMIIRAGVNIYPREIENVLYQHTAVVDCAVFGVPNDRDGEHPVAVVEVRTAVEPDELNNWCRKRLDPYKVPSRIEIVDELPRDPNGKVLKRLLRDKAWAGTGRAI